ncbi:uncharacterized protein LOC124142552 [Haliotis rufescens]|uniref:uncharacterized protein LOC124142552 n=1 Tax=Haliotis rufescens TaxID=6454 RepID=UPI00201E90AD|nr:uncharacterized protein LOC124142552 [Haliotis rufescens]
MAGAAVKLTDEFLRCAICTEILQKPCTLVCYHTFCRKCVVNYTKTKPDAISAKSLLCPFCSKMTKVSDPEKPVEEWADDVKPSFVIQGLLDSFGPGSNGMTNCELCEVTGDLTPAVSWCSVCDDALCERCVAMHKRIPATRNHDVTLLSGDVKVKQRKKVMCEEHKSECIEFDCKDCKKAICQKCCIVYHRKCSSVVTLESELSEIKSSLTRNKGSLLTRLQGKTDQVEKQKLKVVELSDSSTEIESQIRASCNEIRDRINQKERTLINKMKDVAGTHIGQLKADIKSGEMSIQMYQQEAELIDQSLGTECQVDMYRMSQWFAEEHEETAGDGTAKDEETIDGFKFTQNTTEINKAVDDLRLGEIDVLYKNTLKLNVPLVLLDTISVKVPGDQDTPNPVEVTVVLVDDIYTVVVTDMNTKCVKSFYTRNNQICHSRVAVQGRPWNLTKLKHNQVAASVLDTKNIVTFEVNPDLVLLSVITTNRQYYGLTSLTQSTLAAGCTSPPCVDILDVTGNVLRSISPLHMGKNTLKSPYFLSTTTTGNILVSDEGSQCIICVNPKGDLLFMLTNTGDRKFEKPLGITSTGTSEILVTDRALGSVIQLNESGQFVRKILTLQDGVQDPYGVYVDGQGRLYICLCSRGVIKVYSSTSRN